MTDTPAPEKRDRASERDRPFTSNDYRFARNGKRVVGPIVNAIYRVRVVGLENIPEGGAILAPNHVSYLDPVILFCDTPRFVHIVAKSELWNVPLVRWAIDKSGGIPVHREQADRVFLQTTNGLLNEGKLVGIFPEGTRHREEGLGEGNDGVAFLATRAGVPVVPMGLSGTDKIMPVGAHIPRFPRVTMVIGEPIHPDDFTEGSRKDRMSAFTSAIMTGIREQLTRAEERPDAS